MKTPPQGQDGDLADDLRRALEAARGQRALTEAIVESLGDACLAADTAGTFLIVNEAARRIFASAEAGHTMPADWAALHRSHRPDGSPLPSEEGALRRGMRGLDTNDLVFTLQRPGADTPIWVEASGRPVRDADGEVVAAVAVYRDVTERKRRDDVYASLAANIPDGAVCIFDRQLRCVAVEGVLRELSPLAPTEMVGRPMRELAGLAPGDTRYDAVEALYRRALEGEAGSVDLEWQGRTLAHHAGPIRDASGAVTEGIVLAIDVTAERKLEAAHRRGEQIYRAIVQHLPAGAVFMIDRDLRYVSADGPILSEMMERTQLGTVVGRLVADVVSPANREAVLATYRAALAGQSQRVEIERDGRFFEVSTVPIREGQEITHALVFSQDVTNSRREARQLAAARDALARERQLLETMIAHVEDAIALLDADRHTIIANQQYADMLGLPLADVIGMRRERFRERFVPLLEDPAVFDAQFATRETPATSEFVLARPRRRVLRRTWTPVRFLDREGFLVSWHDITAERDLLAERERQALIDPLTGVPNRRAAEQAMRAEHERHKRQGTPMCLAMFDLDHFKAVNDRHGHGAGDDVLRAVATALAAEARLTDTLARWGGEEFIAVLNVPLDGARAFCERARQAVERLQVPPVPRVTISAGVAEVGASEPASDALARADERLYEAKRAGRNRVVA